MEVATTSQTRGEAAETPAGNGGVGAGAGGQGGGNAAQHVTQSTQPLRATQLPLPGALPSLQEAHSTYIPTHKWPPKAVRPQFTRILTSLWNRLASNPADERLWVMEAIFYRAVLPAGQGPQNGDTTSHVSLIRERLRRWEDGQCGDLWAEAVTGQQAKPRRKKKRVEVEILSQDEHNARRCATLTK